MNWYTFFKFAQRVKDPVNWNSPLDDPTEEPTQITPEVEESIVKWYTEKNMSANSIANLLRVPVTKITFILRKNNVNVKSKEESAGRRPIVERDQSGDDVIKDFWELYNKNRQLEVPEHLKIMLSSLGQKYNFLRKKIPNFESLVHPFRYYKSKFDSATANAVVRAYRLGYSAVEIAKFLGVYPSLILALVTRVGIVRNTSEAAEMKRTMKQRFVLPLAEIIPNKE